MEEGHEHPAVRRARAFYEWELRGRGWLSSSYPVLLEPPFRPFFHDPPPGAPLDDARRPTFLSRLAERLAGRAPGAEQGEEEHEEEPNPEPFTSPDRAEELVLSLPPGSAVHRDSIEAWLLSLRSLAWPLSFELVGSSGLVTIRFAPRGSDRAHLIASLRSFFSDAALVEPEATLLDLWQETHGPAEVVEFGLSREFVLPLRSGKRLEPDPLTALVAALSDLDPGEIGVAQVLFAPATAPWTENAIRAVTTPQGKPFFADTPELTARAREKVSTPLFAAVLRLAAKASSERRVWDVLGRLSGALSVYADPLGNELVPLGDGEDLAGDLLSRRSRRSGMLLSLTELAEIVHPPAASLDIPALWRDSGRSKAPPEEALGEGLLLGENLYQGRRREARLSREARLRHTHLIGASGTGKSTLLASMILEDLEEGRGVGVIDPHGDLVDEVLGRMPAGREKDLVLFDPAEPEVSAGWNILEARGEAEKNMLASDLVSVFQRLSRAWGDNMTAVLANAVLVLLEARRPATLADLARFLRDGRFREEYLSEVDDPYLLVFWREEFPKMRGHPEEPILVRLNGFLRTRLIRDVLSEVRTGIDFRRLVDEGGVLLGKLSQGAIGEENSSLLGSLLVAKLHQAALSREELRPEARRPFFLYLDEFHLFATASMASLFAGIRKYRLAVTVAHQDLRQLRDALPEVEHAVTSNAYSRIIFRVGDEDAKRLAGGLSWFRAEDLLGLETGEAIVRLGRQTADFNVKTHLLPEVAASEQEARRRRIREALRGRRSEPEEPSPYRPPLEREEAPARKGKPPAEEDLPSPPRATRTPSRPRPKDEPEPPGRGGAEHTYLQELVRRFAQERGLRAEVEHELAGGGRVDVALFGKESSTAVEIAVSSRLEEEVEHVRRAREAGFDRVGVVSRDRRFLSRLAKALEEVLPEEEREAVALLAPEEIPAFLAAEPAVERVAGYKVKVRYKKADGSEEGLRAAALRQALAKSLKRMKEGQ